jgi:hypothetical protein
VERGGVFRFRCPCLGPTRLIGEIEGVVHLSLGVGRVHQPAWRLSNLGCLLLQLGGGSLIRNNMSTWMLSVSARYFISALSLESRGCKQSYNEYMFYVDADFRPK